MNITLKNISKRYGKLTVLDGLNLSFADGALTALLGPSGCGKTTILNIISGVLHPDRGDVFFGDRCVTDMHLSRRNIGYVFQNYALYPNMTAYENLKFPLTNLPLPGKNRAEKKEYYDQQIMQIARLLRIEDALRRYPSELSGGQQQRIALGRAIIRKPDILLMDEPFANLDRKLSIEMREEIRQIQQKTGLTTIFVTHNQTDANAISDQIVLMNKGEIQQTGTPSQLYDEPVNLFCVDFFGEYGANILDRYALLSCCPGLISCWPRQASTAVCRPEDVTVIAGDGPFKVRNSTHMGGRWLHQMQCGHLRLSALTDEKLSVGTRIALAIMPDGLNFYDSQGHRLPAAEVE